MASKLVARPFYIKILPFVLILILIFLVIRNFVFTNKQNIKSTNLRFLLFGSFLSLLFWLINFPQYRFGFGAITIFLFIFFESIFGTKKDFIKKRYIYFLIIGLIYFNVSNVSRIISETNRDDMYRFTNFPWYAKPLTKQITEKNRDFRYLRSTQGDKFWRTCFNSKLICVNHDDKVSFKQNGRIIFISKF